VLGCGAFFVVGSVGYGEVFGLEGCVGWGWRVDAGG
jgi:hypothetical protein